ncbi:tetratricopeptide repeat protein [Rhizobium sp. P32RR-XVIII]|uniref:FecR domain-containing protein n=1 Tax=Rhizobium sp. P32RR-XVIII TaxID=2726738 RepID=UPI0014577436|nr:FecR domain-containing protein [Rhizobium sp. P32RR-XVIII]NLS04981.1 tetratricopeptide repeat protein [Rhizobium sp. P32RR-XVIII]
MRGKSINSAVAATALCLAAFFVASPAVPEPVRRPTPAAGSVIDRKIGEEVRFVDLSNWQNVDLHQDLLGGDVLRTNATGQLAILFADRTQVRLGRNSSLQVKRMAPTGETILNLQSGTMWARAQRGGQGLTVETPAAAAAIRGTDWTLTVKGDQTSLIVLEGRVELRNEHGSVEVAQGEGAVATIGQAPRKLVIVTPDDREQMLFYLTLRSGFTFMPASPLSVQKMRSERSRIEAKVPAARSAEEWLTLAEVQLSLDGRQKALESLAKARAKKLSAAQRARADLIEALIAGAEKRYDEAAKLFSRAQPALDPERRSIAAYGAYYSRSLRNPNHAEKPPANVTGPYAAVMKAYTAGFLEDIPAAIETMKQAEARYPNDSTLPALRAQLAMLINDRLQMKEAIDRSLSIDPTDPTALQARARMRADFEGNLDDALEDLNAAIKVAPGSSMAWNDLGLLQDARGAPRESEAALKKSIELDPDDPIGHANLAILYLDQSRMKEAKREIDLALAADPAFDIALLARGRYYLQTGEMDKAIDDLLAASTANPAYSQAQLMLAAGHYENGDRDPSNQALDNADRLDKNDPVISNFRTAVAIDDYDADGAIRYAQEFLRRSKARGGHYGSLGANQDAGSTLNNAFRLQGLNAWGRYYGDAVFDPFAGSGYVDQSIRGNIRPFANTEIFDDEIDLYKLTSNSFSSLLQGLLLDPHMLSGRSRSANLLRRPFLEGSLGGGFINSAGETKPIGEAEIQGFANEPFPISGFANVTWDQIPTEGQDRSFAGGFFGPVNFSGDIRTLSGNAYLTATPNPDDRFVLYANHADAKIDQDLAIPLAPFEQDGDSDTKATAAGLGWSHTFGYRNVLNAAAFYTDADQDLTQVVTFPPGAERIASASQKSYIAAINHLYGDDELTWRYGVEGGFVDVKATDEFAGIPLTNAVDEEIGIGRAYVDLLHEIRPDLKAEYALFGTLMDGETVDSSWLEPRIGVAWAPADGQWLRAAFLRQSFDFGSPTLSPIGILGLQSNVPFIGIDGYTDTIALQWDAQWTDYLFTTVDYQHQEIRDLNLAYPTGAPFIFPFAFSTGTNIDDGRIDRVSATTNIALGHGFGVSATVAYADSKDNDPTSPTFGGSLPYVPEKSGQLAVTWVNEANVKATLAANYIGERDGIDPLLDSVRLDDYWTLDANLIWEPLDKRFALEAAAFNLLDDDFEVAPGVPGWGRAVKASLKVRF